MNACCWRSLSVVFLCLRRTIARAQMGMSMLGCRAERDGFWITHPHTPVTSCSAVFARDEVGGEVRAAICAIKRERGSDEALRIECGRVNQ